MIYLGLKALEHQKGDRPTFKRDSRPELRSPLYTDSARRSSLPVRSQSWAQNGWRASLSAINAPMSRVALGQFLGLFLGALLFGLIYSTVLSFFLAKRRSEDA